MSNIGFASLYGLHQVAEAADVGFKTIINICPDFKLGSDQVTSAAYEQECATYSLNYLYQPISDEIAEVDVIEFAGNFNLAEKSVLVLGKTGEIAIDLHLIAMQMDLLIG